MYQHARAILWAQWRTLRNFYPRSGVGGLIFSVLVGVVWYGLWAAGAVGVTFLLAYPSPAAPLTQMIPAGLFLMLLYWQVIPILMVATGTSLDLKKLMVYPIPPAQLFGLEVLLRVSTGLEMLLLLCGATAGLLLNPKVPAWAPLAFVPFILFNLFLSAGLRDLLTRLLARRRFREIAMFVFVILAAIPQLLVSTGKPQHVPAILTRTPNIIWPWGAAGRLAAGEASLAGGAILVSWTLAAGLFGRWQFRRSLRFDEQAAGATVAAPARRDSLIEKLYRWPSVFFSDPLAVLIEKELRFLSRAPRFRLVFFMGFSFGLLIWLPLAFGRPRSPDSFFAANYLTIVSVYALMLLGDVLFWNSLGFDRSAAQVYFVTPLRFSTVLIAKNVTAAVFVVLEITAVALVCALFRMPVSLSKIVETFAVTAVLTLYLLSMGNLGSTHQPRPTSPAQSWRSSSAKGFQALLLIVYPLLALPVVLAYLARYAFDSQLAFWGVLAIGAAIGAIVYSISMESAVNAAEQRKERIISVLSAGEGPVSA